MCLGVTTRPRGRCPCAGHWGFLWWARITRIVIIPVIMTPRASTKWTQELHCVHLGCWCGCWCRRCWRRCRRWSVVFSSLQVAYIPCQFFYTSPEIIVMRGACRIVFAPCHFVCQSIVFFLQIVVHIRHLLLGTSSGHFSFEIVVPSSKVVVHLSLHSTSVRVLLQL